MTDSERFEPRFAAALQRLADEAPTEVAPELVARTAAAANRRRSWRLPIVGTWTPSTAAALRLALALLALLSLLAGALIVGQRIAPAPAPYEGMLAGQIVCAGSPWTSGSGAPVTLDCTSDLPDSRLEGAVRVKLDESTRAQGGFVRSGSIELGAGDASWAGDLRVATGGNGVTAGGAVLIGSGTARGLVLDLDVISADGLTWGAFGSMRSTP